MCEVWSVVGFKVVDHFQNCGSRKRGVVQLSSSNEYARIKKLREGLRELDRNPRLFLALIHRHAPESLSSGSASPAFSATFSSPS
jgi:hypothetical protein